MSMAPRGTRKRRLALLEGRRKMALLAGTALIAGAGAGATVPALAGSGMPAGCDGQTVEATVTVDGADVTCTVPTDTATTDTTTAPADDQQTTTPTTTTPVPADTTGTPADTVTTPGEAPAPPAAAPADDATAGGDAASSPTPAVTAMPTGADTGAQPDAPEPAPQAPPAGGHAKDVRETPHHPRHERMPAPADHAPGHAAPTTGTPASADIGAPLPASWTSLEPIVLPAFSLADFPVPAAYLPLYQAAGAEYGVPWEVLAAINEIETGYGRNARESSAGAIGFMQFLRSTWQRWGRDADGDRRRDPRDPADAVFSAARYLHAAGAATDLAGAVYAYNHAHWYVDRVLTRARELAGIDASQIAALTARAIAQHHDVYQVAGSPFFGRGLVEPSPGQILTMTHRELTRRVLNDDRLDLYACGRQDVEAGRVDDRVLATLLFLVASGYRLQVTSLECGHSRLTTSGNVSAHSYGAAVDIAAVNGIPILGHQGPGSIADAVVHRLLDLQGYLRPAQIISLMTVAGADNTLALPDHDDHIHVGFSRPVTLGGDA